LIFPPAFCIRSQPRRDQISRAWNRCTRRRCRFRHEVDSTRGRGRSRCPRPLQQRDANRGPRGPPSRRPTRTNSSRFLRSAGRRAFPSFASTLMFPTRGRSSARPGSRIRPLCRSRCRPDRCLDRVARYWCRATETTDRRCQQLVRAHFVQNHTAVGALATWKQIRAGRLDLIRPVITSTVGFCVARIKWMPTARLFCASR